MAKLNFQQFTIPMGISGEKVNTGDIRESVADLLYLNVPGIRSHRLAFKIYESEGATEYSDEEVKMIRSVAEGIGLPSFIDGLKKALENQNNEV